MKSEVFVACAKMVTEVLGTGQIQGVRAMLAEIIEYNRTLEAFILAAEANAEINESGVMCPDVMDDHDRPPLRHPQLSAHHPCPAGNVRPWSRHAFRQGRLPKILTLARILQSFAGKG